MALYKCTCVCVYGDYELLKYNSYISFFIHIKKFIRVSEFPGSPGTLSPTSSVFSGSIAPTIPSAPMSPADSEFLDDSQFDAELWCSSPGMWAVNSTQRSHNQRDLYLRSSSEQAYHSTGKLDTIRLCMPTHQSDRYVSRSSSAGPSSTGGQQARNRLDEWFANEQTILPYHSFADNIKNLANSYRFEKEENGGISRTHVRETNSESQPGHFVTKQTNGGGQDGSLLRYP